MTVSFNLNSEEKFQEISDQSFAVNHELLSRVDLTQPLQHRQCVPIRQAIKTAAICDFQPVSQSVTLPNETQLVYDLGELVVGHFAVDLQAIGAPMDAPLLLHVRFAETLAELDEDVATVDSWLPLSWIQDEQRHVDVLPQRLTFERRYSCRYIALAAVGQSRKWQPQFSQPVFDAEGAAINQTVAPLTQLPEWLQTIDKKCIQTLKNTMQVVFEDGTKRDRRLWLSDFRTQALVNYATFQNTIVAKRCLYLFGSFMDDTGRIPADILTLTGQPVADDLFWFDYELLFPVALADYVDATDDLATLRELYPVVQRVMAFLKTELTANLVGPRQDVFIDWSSQVDKEAAVQLQAVMTIQRFVDLAQRMTDPQLANYEDWLTDLTQATLNHYFDSQLNAVVSGPKREISPLSQIYVLLADILSPTATEAVIDRLLKFDLEQTVTTPNTQGLLAEALFKHHHQDDALAVIRLFWQGMVDRGADTFWEVYDAHDPNYSPYGSILLNGYCFGWSAYPAYLLRRYL